MDKAMKIELESLDSQSTEEYKVRQLLNRPTGKAVKLEPRTSQSTEIWEQKQYKEYMEE